MDKFNISTNHDKKSICSWCVAGLTITAIALGCFLFDKHYQDDKSKTAMEDLSKSPVIPQAISA